MSATFKNAKKNSSQAELRKLMNEHKNKIKVTKKIDSPLAKYNDLGQLTCILCQSVVRSETVWSVHLNSKHHREKVEQAKKLKERTNNFTTSLKRPPTPPLPEVPTKKLKGILKNAPSRVNEPEELSSNGIPADFFDNKLKTKAVQSIQGNNTVKEVDKNIQVEKMEVEPVTDIPEGFFDDPKQDAKARNIDYKDPIEEEWEKFQKAIRDANTESAAIIAEDQEEATNERQIDEIEEQMKNWSRVINMEKKKIEVIATVSKEASNMETEEGTDEEADYDEFLDWRSKKLFKR